MITIMAKRKRSEKSFSICDYVYLKLHPYRQQSTSHRSFKKLDVRFFRPYQVIAKVGSVAYKLELPFSTAIHLIFHMHQLKRIWEIT